MPYARAAILAFLISVPALAGTSADYSLEPAALDGGGALDSSAAYTINPSTAPGGASASADYALRNGYAGQLLDIVGITIDESSSPMTLNERGTLQLTVSATYDDATKAILSAKELTWSVHSGPLAGIDGSALVTAGSVYQNTAAVARAALGNISDTVSLSVINTGLDDFAPYAADGLPDIWQVQSFGESGTLGGPAMDYDGDGVINLHEFAFGSDPGLPSAGFVRWSGATSITPGLPIPYVFQSGTGTFSYRAAFSRRKDYAALGISYVVEFSGDLSTWKASPSTSTPTVLADSGTVQVVYVPYLIFVNGKKANFFRVKVQTQ
jgi:hypothetical protein